MRFVLDSIRSFLVAPNKRELLKDIKGNREVITYFLESVLIYVVVLGTFNYLIMPLFNPLAPRFELFEFTLDIITLSVVLDVFPLLVYKYDKSVAQSIRISSLLIGLFCALGALRLGSVEVISEFLSSNLLLLLYSYMLVKPWEEA